ncbi:type 4a pilus biogenesis protein PilO [Thermodesulfobacteriota bacterium]
MEDKSFFEKIEDIKMPIRLLILFGTIILLVGAFMWFAYLPKTEEIKNTTNSIADLNRKLQRAKIERKKLPKRKAEKAEVDAQFKEALKLLPNTKEIPMLLSKITELGNNSQLDCRVFIPRGERPKDFFMEIPISIEVRGTYHNVAVFFDRVGRLERIINIQNVSMKPISARSTSLITTCDATTYRFKGN